MQLLLSARDFRFIQATSTLVQSFAFLIRVCTECFDDYGRIFSMFTSLCVSSFSIECGIACCRSYVINYQIYGDNHRCSSVMNKSYILQSIWNFSRLSFFSTAILLLTPRRIMWFFPFLPRDRYVYDCIVNCVEILIKAIFFILGNINKNR